MTRVATLVLISPAGELLGQLPPIELGVPYWPETAELVEAARTRFGAELWVLRLLSTEPERQSGGAVSYSAELIAGAPPLEPIPESVRALALGRDAKRMAWADIGGPTRSLDWARGVLGPFVAVQHRTWNLSALWRLQPQSAHAAPVWLKQVPPFMRYESTLLRWLNRAAPGTTPELLAADAEGRSLLAHVAGEDAYGAPVAVRQAITDQLHVIQTAAASSIDELLALGVPDRRGARRSADARQRLLAHVPDYPGLEPLLQRFDEQMNRLEECELPATLVHGDNHPGNARQSAEGVRLLDWGEAYIGHPVTDLLGATAGLSREQAAPLHARWCEMWKRIAPRCRPERALQLAPFVRELSGAALFASFSSQIERSEWPYHQRDVPRCLEAARAAEG